jgi:undecaprenol kinase
MTLAAYARKQLKSFRFAFRGIGLMMYDYNFWFHLPAAVLVVVFGIWLRVSVGEWLWLVMAVFLVLIAETVNTSIEKAVDLVTEEKHPLARDAKDLAAGAVLLASIFGVVVALIVFVPKLWSLMGFSL